MELKTLLYETNRGIGIVTLNRPKTMNALNDEMINELSMAMDEISTDNQVQAIIITGGERVFATGGDMDFMSSADSLPAEKIVEATRLLFDKIDHLDKPIIAAISGAVLGMGCELALTCDIRIAAEGTSMGQPAINLGIIPGAGGTLRITRIVGPGWAKYLAMTGLTIDTDTAFKIGLITAVVPEDQLMDEAKKIAGILVSKSQAAMKTGKRCLNFGMTVDLPSGLSDELKMWASLYKVLGLLETKLENQDILN